MAVCLGVVAGAPLLAGGVHRGSMLLLMAAGALGLVALASGLGMQGRTLRIGAGVVLPLAFLLIPLAQSIPLPMSVRILLDRNGTALLQDDQVQSTTTWPLSLDPAPTRVDVGRAALGLMAFLLAYHLASGQSRRHLLLRVLAGAALAGVAIGLGHRILGIARIYGGFATSARSLLAGPFVNPNHTAEFLELGAFVCLACSLQRPTALNRVGWLIGTLLCAGGAAVTLSRGAVLALAAGVVVFTFLRYFGADGHAPGRRRASLAWGGALLALVMLGAGALGAGQLIDRFKTDAVSTDVRLRVWSQGLRVFAAHPFGIGRGAFDRVFPIYRTFHMPFALRFAFVENEPLQLLIDCGWLFTSLLIAAAGVVAWAIVRRGRRDRIEAALVAGLFAVGVHNTVDFGLETLGILLPFMAVLGVILGRLPTPAAPAGDRWDWSRRSWPLVGAASLAALFGFVSLASPAADDFDALLKQRMPIPEERALLTRAEETHPLDYFYALADARLQPLKGAPGTPSPRLHALNRALRLCPSCEAVHADVARNLWRMGLRPQALLEWRTAVEIQPSLFPGAIGEIFAQGGKPQELAAVASTSGDLTLQLVDFLSRLGRTADALVVLDQANALGAPRGGILLSRAGLEIQSSRFDEAAATLEAARAAGVNNAAMSELTALLLLKTKGPAGADEALSILDRGATRFPGDVDLQRQRIDLVIAYQKWNAASRALEGFKQALYQLGGSAAEAHIAAARIAVRLGHLTEALTEYRIALTDYSENTTYWIEYAQIAATSGHDDLAREAYRQAARLSPQSPEVAAALHALDERRDRLRTLLGEGAASGPGTADR
ncbi:MAG TPA: O-antigen ligase family protein [Polyangia bacterium]|nr:O-antigen ligase family protein [Polyangia bacterium]